MTNKQLETMNRHTAILWSLEDGLSRKEAAAKFGVSFRQVGNIARGDSGKGAIARRRAKRKARESKS